MFITMGISGPVVRNIRLVILGIGSFISLMTLCRKGPRTMASLNRVIKSVYRILISLYSRNVKKKHRAVISSRLFSRRLKAG